jgi:hypothetical protein
MKKWIFGLMLFLIATLHSFALFNLLPKLVKFQKIFLIWKFLKRKLDFMTEVVLTIGKKYLDLGNIFLLVFANSIEIKC